MNPNELPRVRMVIVDDHRVVRSGLAALLGRHSWISVVGEAGSVTEAIREAVRLRPDIVLMDVRLPDGKGYLLKEIDESALLGGIREVAAGRSILDPAVTRKVLEHTRQPHAQSAREKWDLLSAQERRVLALVAAGKTNKEIGLALDLSDKTVKNYFSNLLDKLQLTRRSQAAAFYVQHTRPEDV